MPSVPLTAPVLIAATTAGVLVGDAYLIHKDRESVSSFCGRHFVKVAVTSLLLLAHFKSWPRFLRHVDPFRFAADRLRPSPS